MVSAHELTAGQQLPAERVLAERFQVSRNVVREALRSLAAMNVLEIRHGIGVFVASLDIDSLVEPLEFALTLEKGTFESLTEARLLLEPGIAALAAARASKRDIAVLRRLLEDSEASVAEPTLFLATDIALHNHVVGMSRNPVLALVVQGLGRLARASRELTNASPAMRAQAVVDHGEIVRAIGKREAADAEHAMRVHLEHVREALAREVTAVADPEAEAAEGA